MTMDGIRDLMKDNGIKSLKDAFEWMNDDRSHGDDYLSSAAKDSWDTMFPRGMRPSDAPKGTEEEVAGYISMAMEKAETSRAVSESARMTLEILDGMKARRVLLNNKKESL